MKTVYIGLVTLGLVAGVWAIVASMSHPTPTPETAVTIVPEPEIEEAALAEIASEPAAQVAPALIGSLRSRNHTIHLYVDRFTIEDSEGEVLANLVTENEFAKLLPELFGDFERMFAGGQLWADAYTYGKLPPDWSYSSARTTVQSVKITSDPWFSSNLVAPKTAFLSQKRRKRPECEWLGPPGARPQTRPAAHPIDRRPLASLEQGERRSIGSRAAGLDGICLLKRCRSTGCVPIDSKQLFGRRTRSLSLYRVGSVGRACGLSST